MSGMSREKPSLQEVLEPRSIAIVGASPSAESIFARQVIQALKEAEFPSIYPVNPKYDEVLGLPCYPSLRAIPGPVDHVVVSIPAESALDLLDDCATKRVKSVQFFTAGFSETGYSERAELERAMLSKARAGGFRIIGPNCVGLYVPKSRLVNARRMPLEPGSIAFISQSGGHAENLPYFGGPRGLRFSKVVSYGNALDVDESELLEYFLEDSETTIVGAYIEGVKDGPRFLKALRQLAARKPVVIYKGGITEAGRRTAFGHTASLSGSPVIFRSLCHQLNVIQVDDMDELIDVLVAVHLVRPVPQGIGSAVLGTGGGPSVLAGDEMEKAGLRLPHLSPEAQAQLRRVLPLPGSILCNPVDATSLLSPQVISATMRILGKLPDIHLLLYHLGFHPMSRWGECQISRKDILQPIIDVLREAQLTIGKPIVLALSPASELCGMKDFLTAQEVFVKAGFPVFHSLGGAAKAMDRAIGWHQGGRLDWSAPLSVASRK